MKTKKLCVKYYALLIILVLSALILPNISQAQILPACTATGNCGICDFLDTFVNIIQWLLGIIAGAALLLMVWHGFSWLIAQGNSEKVEAGKKGLTHTVLGMVIVIIAWQLVNIIMVILINPPGGVTQNLFNSPNAWHEYCSLGNVCQGKGIGSPCGGGNFCKNDGQSLICGTGPAENACKFWATYPKAMMGGTNPYDGYDCYPKNDCNPYENLGTAYCVQSGNEITSCCHKN